MAGTYFTQKATSFQGRSTPEEGYLAGYARLLYIVEQETNVMVPLPDQLALISEKRRQYEKQNWQVFAKSYQPNDYLSSHLIFALKYEGIQLQVIKTLFEYTGKSLVLSMINREPTSQYTRRAWFLYEWLMGEKLYVPDLTEKAGYVEIVNPKLQYTGTAINSTRHRVRNNLPGTPEFCPMIRKTEKLEKFITKNLDQKIEDGLSVYEKDLIRRTAAFLLLKDSKASFAIEGEYPPNIRARNWGRAIGQAGKNELSIAEIERLQNIVIGSRPLSQMGIRKTEGFIGEHDRQTYEPIPDHISAKAVDLSSLMKGLLDTNQLLQKSNYDPVMAATTIAFGFVFIHPLIDGNGRIHRYIIHHLLNKMGYTKRELMFPVSAAILDRIGDYQDVLEAYSAPRLEHVEWKSTTDHNAEILNDTIDLYRYYDLTKQAEFLYECVEDTIERIIPEELDYLAKYDRLAQIINDYVTLPDNKVDLLIKFIHQNHGRLSNNKRQSHYEELSDEEISYIENAYQETFENMGSDD